MGPLLSIGFEAHTGLVCPRDVHVAGARSSDAFADFTSRSCSSGAPVRACSLRRGERVMDQLARWALIQDDILRGGSSDADG